MQTADERIAAAMAAVRAAGGRSTTARGAVLRVLAGAGHHLSAAEIHAELTAGGGPLDLSTVHRVLAALTRLDVVHAVPVGGSLTFGMADRAHHHTVCRTCGTVRQLSPQAVAAAIGAATADGLFTTDADGRDVGVVVYGRCATCPERQS